MAAGHGGQVLLSLATEELVRAQLPADVALRDMGERRLKDLIRPERVYQVTAPDLAADFPPLNTLDARPNNLPAQTTPFIGREDEIRAIRELLSRGRTRLLTLSGVGRHGKDPTSHCSWRQTWWMNSSTASFSCPLPHLPILRSCCQRSRRLLTYARPRPIAA
jgi:hypothetical protein